MAAEKINIASLQIDSSKVIQESVKLKKVIDEVKVAQAALRKEGDTSSKTYVENEVKLKSLGKAYRDNQTFAISLEKANKDLVKTMSTENKSVQELRDSRSQLIKIVNQLNSANSQFQGTKEEEIALRDRLNDSIDKQTKALREGSSEFNSSKDKIGEYKDEMGAAFQELNIFNGGLLGLVSRSKAAGGSTQFLTTNLKAAGKGILGLTKASLSFIATPLGIVLAAIAGAFFLVQNAMNRSEDSTNKVKVAFASVSGIVQKVLKVLEPLGVFLIDNIVKGFELAGEAAEKSMELISSGLSLLGFDDEANSVNEFSESIKNAAKEGRDLARAEIEMEKAQRVARLTLLEYQKQAEDLRQIRDDSTKGIKAQQKANEDLSAVLKEQGEVEKAIAQTAIDFANKRIKIQGETKENLDLQAQAVTELADVQERINGQESEQLTNRVALQKEAAAQAKKIQEDAIKLQGEQLDKFIQEQGVRAKTLEEQLKVAESIAKREIEIKDAELKAKVISETKYASEVLKINNDLGLLRAELAVSNFEKELESYIELNQSKIDNEKFLSEEVYNEEVSRLERIAEARREFEAQRLSEGVISQTEYNEAIKQVNSDNQDSVNELEAERREAENVREAEDYLNKIEVAKLRAADEFEQKQIELDVSKRQEVANAEATGADVAIINEKYAELQKQLDRSVRDANLDGLGNVLGGAKDFFGEKSQVGKVAAIGEATVNTYQAANLALATYPAPFGAISAGVAIASGLANVAKIQGTPIKFNDGGILKGDSHANGGIPFLINGKAGFEAEGNESIINAKSTSMFAPLLSAINVAGGGKKFNTGGSLGSVINSGSMVSLINYDLLASKVSEANASLPNPVVGVSEIQEVAGNIETVENLATFGN